MSARRLILAGLVSLCASCGSFALADASAQAAVTHNYLSQESPEAYKPVNEVGPVAVDESTSLTDWAKGDTFEVVGAGRTIGGVVDVFEPEGGGKRKLVGQLTGTSPSEPFEFLQPLVAINDTNGDVIVNHFYAGKHVLGVFEPTLHGEYAFVHNIVSPAGGSIGVFAVDQSSGGIYAEESYGSASESVFSVAEFSSAGAYLDQITGAGSPTGSFLLISSVTVDPSTHDVYVLDPQRSIVDIFGPDVTIPDVTPGPVARLTGKNATLTGTVNPDRAGAATCQFVWGATKEFGHAAPCSAPIAEGENPVPVEAQLSGLQPDTSYCYRLQATDANGTNIGEPSQDRCFTTAGLEPRPATVSAVTAESATFEATINPRNIATAYYFQYGTTSGYGTDVPAAPGAAVGSGEGNVEVSQHVQKLDADTIYHYRVVELIEIEGRAVEEFDGPDQTFTTQRSGGFALPDGRQWEMVTPPQKQGALFEGVTDEQRLSEGRTVSENVIQAAAGGSAIADIASVPSEAEPQGYAAGKVSVLSTRGASGWSSQVIAPPHAEATGPNFQGGEYRLFSDDLSRGVVQPSGPFDPLLSGEATEATAYLHADFLNGNVSEHCQTSCFQPLVTSGNTRPGAVFGEMTTKGECYKAICGPRFVAGTPDLSHVILSSEVQLTSTPAEESLKKGQISTSGQTGGCSWSAFCRDAKRAAASSLPASLI